MLKSQGYILPPPGLATPFGAAFGINPQSGLACNRLLLPGRKTRSCSPTSPLRDDRFRKVDLADRAGNEDDCPQPEILQAAKRPVHDEPSQEEAGLLAAGDGAPAIRRHNCLGSAATTSDRT